MTNQTNNTNAAAQTQTNEARKGPKPMRYGRAMKLDASRASDEVIAEAIAFLDAYDTAGHASSWVQEAIDERIQALNDEGDRREGVEPVYVPRQPSQREVWEALAAEPAEPGDEATDAPQDDAQEGTQATLLQ